MKLKQIIPFLLFTIATQYSYSVVYPSITYYPVTDPSARPLNTTSYLVGTTKGNFDVNPAGGANYSIPIEVTPGINGLAPSLSLVYSSNAGSNMAGYGWSIGGLSVIGRTGQTYYNDGTAIGVNLAASDKFTLDGQRLVATSGIYGANLTTYQTEIDIITRVQSLGTLGTGPASFKAQTKSGLTNVYGNTPDSKPLLPTINEPVNWFISGTTDLYGNTISYSYLSDNNNIYPSQIIYGLNTITFSYKTRTDVTASYLKGQKIQQLLLLDKITIAYNSNILKSYEMRYNLISDNYNSYSVLNELIEYGTGSSRLNSMVFSYQTPSNVAISQTLYNTTDSYITYKSKLYAGDFNGDGKADFLCLPDASKGATWTGWKMYLGDGNDSFSFSSSGTGDYNFIGTADLNGDGKEDLIMSWYWSDGYATTERFESWISNGISFNATNYFAEKEVSFGYYSGSYAFGYDNGSADFNGDGLADFLIYRESGYWEIYSYSYSNGTLNNISLQFSGTVSSLNNKVYYGDFNGDGKADIWNIDSNGTKIYSLNGSSLTQIYSSTFPNKNHYFKLGDFNADGKTDMFLYGWTTYDWGDWQVLLSTGTGFETLYIPKKKSNLKDDIVRTGDFNGDGCTDLMVTANTDNGWVGHYYYISKNKGKDFYSHFLQGSVAPIPSHNYYVADYNGDGRTDFICTDGLSPWWNGYQMYKSTGNTAPLLEKVANGLSHLTTIAYTKLSQASTLIYQKGSTTPSFPVFNFQGSLPVVSSATIDNGIGGTNALSYYYEGAKIHRQGKGFLCYSKMIVTDATAGIANETLNGYDNTYFYPQVNTVTRKTTGGTTIEATTNTWASPIVLDASTKRIFPYISSSTQTNALTGHSVTTTTTLVDNYGNPGQVVKSYNNGVAETTVNNFSSLLNTTDWLVGRLGSTTVTYSKTGETSVSQAVRYTYFTDGIVKPDLIYYNEGTALEYYKNHDYDAKGNLTQVYTSGASIGASQTNYTYDTNGIGVITATDALGHVNTNTYDTYGQLQTEKDYLNNTNTYGYDALARQTSVSNTNGSQTTTSYVWTGTNNPTLGVYGVTQTGNDGSVSTTWYDKLGRAIRSEKKGFGGQMILTDTEYNAKGQVYRVSDPYFAGGSVAWAETYTTYDVYGRVTAINRNTTRNSTFSYPTNRATETTAGKTSWKDYDSQGLVTTAHDNGGDIIYTYYPDGKVKTITAPGGVVTSMQYADAARNQTQLVDPSAGTINYTYDSFGRVKTQTDARNKLTTYAYYPDGRINTRVTPEGTTTYTYNTNKQLTGISSPGSVSRSYGYDAKGRVNTIGENIAGSLFSTSFTYDSFGRLSIRNHPSGVVETLGYNSNGYLSTISAGGSIRYTLTSMNAREQLTAATYGSGTTLNATFGFDTYGYPNSTATGSVQNYSYSFNPVTGNLNWRKNVNRSNITENFSYTDNGDNLDRLTKVTGPQNLDMTYAATGNILTKSDINSSTAFSYGASAGPYALTGATSSTGVIPSTSQTATYTSFEKVNTLSEGVYAASFIYNSDNQRAKMTVNQSGANVVTRWYIGSSDMRELSNTVNKEYSYLGGDAYTAPVVAVNTYGTIVYYYLLRDYLGNITHVYNATTSTAQEYSFDAWGRRRNPVDWSYNLTGQPELFADRGFTSHEHLKWFNVVNMNGRLYDPLLGRFMNADPYVQMPDYTQNFNRYSYCLNNPLRFTDPDGEWIWIPLMIIGAYIGGTSANDGELNPGNWNWKDGSTWGGVLIGGAVGAMGGYGIMNPGSVSLFVGTNTALGSAGLTIGSATAATGFGTNWDYNFSWTTAAGGGGNYNLNGRNTSPEQIGDRAVAEARANASGGYSQYSQPGDQFLLEFGMAGSDFYQNYGDMRTANTIGADKYFHSKANFQAASRGPGGLFFAIHFSNLREIWDQNIKGYPRWDSLEDQKANQWGRDQVGRTTDGSKAAEKFRPHGLPIQY